MFSLANLLTLHWSYRVFGILNLHECFSSSAPGWPSLEQDMMICTDTLPAGLAGKLCSESPILLFSKLEGAGLSLVCAEQFAVG